MAKKLTMQLVYPYLFDANGDVYEQYAKNRFDLNYRPLSRLELYLHLYINSVNMSENDAKLLIDKVCFGEQIDKINLLVGDNNIVHTINGEEYVFNTRMYQTIGVSGIYSELNRTIYIFGDISNRLILHEIAHSFFKRWTVEDHGPEYCAKYFDLLAKYAGFDKNELYSKAQFFGLNV